MVSGNTPLIYSAMVGNDIAIELLIRSFRRLGFNVDHVNDDGMTALLISAQNGFVECASILALEGKACISFRDRERGMNAEEWARSQGCSTPEIVPFSIQASLLNCRKYDPDRTSPVGAQDTSGDSGEELGNVKMGRGRKPDRDLNIGRLGERLSQLSPDGSVDSTPLYPNVLHVCDEGARSRRKRSSLPTIKFHGNFTVVPERGHLDPQQGNQKVIIEEKKKNKDIPNDSSQNTKQTQKRKISIGNRNQDKTSASMSSKSERDSNKSPSKDKEERRRRSTATLASTSRVEVELESSSAADEVTHKRFPTPART